MHMVWSINLYLGAKDKTMSTRTVNLPENQWQWWGKGSKVIEQLEWMSENVNKFLSDMLSWGAKEVGE